MHIKIPLNTIMGKSFGLIRSNIPFHLEKSNRTMKANIARVAIVTGTGNSTYLPKAPDVAIKNIAILISKTCWRCNLFIPSNPNEHGPWPSPSLFGIPVYFANGFLTRKGCPNIKMLFSRKDDVHTS